VSRGGGKLEKMGDGSASQVTVAKAFIEIFVYMSRAGEYLLKVHVGARGASSGVERYDCGGKKLLF
jgi:hypothetical protein